MGFVVLLLATLVVALPTRAQYCRYGRPTIVGFAHPYDVIYRQYCGPYGCRPVPQQIPCQHPIWDCP